MVPRLCVLTSAGLFLSISILHLIRSVFRNFTFGNDLGRLTLVLETPLDALGSSADTYRVDISLPRRWKVKAGEWINLTLPRVGFLYAYQAHPFTVAWWEEDEAGYASSISLLIKARSGFTQKLLKQIQPYTEYKAWIDGPYGPARTNTYSLSKVGDYGHLIMFATDIGIAAQIPYIKETLKGIKKCKVKTRSICLVWQMNKAGALPNDQFYLFMTQFFADDLDLVRHWLQQLVAEDENYHLKLLVYNSNENPSSRDPVPYGQHDRILISGGEPNWDDHLQNEMKARKGRLLIMMATQHHIRKRISNFIFRNACIDTDLFELEFQPWAVKRSC
ncbi:FAD-binding domain-containing protein [Histoplasma capsulatum G186AR]|uniref:ferric-chelate reductase (NADPH) n=1 Tax=Ajellomyces capsulatus TaxID=5037 RepID=A0A8H7YSH4_AJECA|nr:FAD-binding domain-containing protein [Histoplasma capsulatum]QSS74449.1 FAD-binding domain-containing protein [Histoplasma capsulatum G186AR]